MNQILDDGYKCLPPKGLKMRADDCWGFSCINGQGHVGRPKSSIGTAATLKGKEIISMCMTNDDALTVSKDSSGACGGIEDVAIT